MEHLITVITVFGIFIPALMLPGPDFVGVVRSTLTGGKRAGLLTTLGVSLMLTVYALVSLLGLSAILERFEWLAWAVKVAGATYLIYLGAKLIVSKPREFIVDGEAGGTPNRAFVFGLGVTLTNPKAMVLFTSVFATSVTGETPFGFMGLMIGLVFLCTLVWYSAVTIVLSAVVGPVPILTSAALDRTRRGLLFHRDRGAPIERFPPAGKPLYFMRPYRQRDSSSIRSIFWRSGSYAFSHGARGSSRLTVGALRAVMTNSPWRSMGSGARRRMR